MTRCHLAPEREPRCIAPAVVRVADPHGGAAAGCEPHAIRALRAITGAKVYPLPGRDGAAIAVFKAANS